MQDRRFGFVSINRTITLLMLSLGCAKIGDFRASYSGSSAVERCDHVLMDTRGLMADASAAAGVSTAPRHALAAVLCSHHHLYPHGIRAARVSVYRYTCEYVCMHRLHMRGLQNSTNKQHTLICITTYMHVLVYVGECFHECVYIEVLPCMCMWMMHTSSACVHVCICLCMWANVSMNMYIQYDSAEWEPAFLSQAREFLFFPLPPGEASK